MTGIKEPGMALQLDIASKKSILYTPGNTKQRATWSAVQPVFLQEDPAVVLGINQIVKMKSDEKYPFMGLFFTDSEYLELRDKLNNIVQNKGKVFILNSTINRLVSMEQRCMLNQFCKYIPQLQEHTEDITSILFRMRHVKEKREIACLRKAVALTIQAHKKAAKK